MVLSTLILVMSFHFFFDIDQFSALLVGRHQFSVHVFSIVGHFHVRRLIRFHHSSPSASQPCLSSSGSSIPLGSSSNESACKFRFVSVVSLVSNRQFIHRV